MVDGGGKDDSGRGNVVAFIKPATMRRRWRSEYKAWENMCLRGRQGQCQVDPAWTGRGGFDRFFNDVGPKPTPEHSLDRIDPADPRYGPGLVRWATKATQTRNRKITIRLTDSNGETRSLGEWAEVVGVRYDTLLRRHRRGWNADEVIHGRDRAQARFAVAIARLPWPVLQENKMEWERQWREYRREGESRGEFFMRMTMAIRVRAWEQLQEYRPIGPDQDLDEAPKPPAHLVEVFDRATTKLELVPAMIEEERRQEAKRRKRALDRRIMRELATELPDNNHEDKPDQDEEC